MVPPKAINQERKRAPPKEKDEARFVVNHFDISKRKLPFLKRNLLSPPMGLPYVEFEFYIDRRNYQKEKPSPPLLVIESKSDHKCPFCNFDTGSDKKLLRHCSRYHSDHLSIRSSTAGNGGLRIHVRPLQNPSMNHQNKLCDYKYISRGPLSNKARCIKKHHRKQMKFTLATLEEAEQENPTITASSDILKERRYYHSRSRLLVTPNSLDYDSDDEPDFWYDAWAEARVEEYSDVTDDEKQFMNRWNKFIRQEGSGLSDKRTAERCLEFVRTHICELKELRLQLLQHLMTLWEHKRIPSTCISLCMAEYDSLQERLPP